MVAPNICGSSVWNLLHDTLLVPRILRTILDFTKTCAPLDRIIREVNELKFHPNSMNQEDGLYLNTSWKPLGHPLKEWRKPPHKDAS
jgi:hypothetical protein